MKFRAWDGIRMATSGIMFSNGNMFTAGDMPLMQYTGLKDKNGKEIYEGDIVEKWSHCSLLERLSPLYNRGVGYYKSLTTTVKWSEQGLNYNIYPHHDDSYWKVIGNIYENRELLKEE